jgi:hypothetical protein
MGKVNTIGASQQKGHSVLCMGDSRARGCINKLHVNFRQNFVVSGFVEPGVLHCTLTSTADSDVSYLTKRDIEIFRRVSNDADKTIIKVG